MSYRIGVDVGGTFTDVVVLNDITGSTAFLKVPSVPSDPSIAITSGIQQILAQLDLQPYQVTSLSHGTTVGTNAIIERNWARTALLSTAGFKDIVEIRRQQRPDTYDLYSDKPPQIATRDLRRDVNERILADGKVERSLDRDQVIAIVKELRKADVQAVAICFVHSYANAAHEEEALQLVNELLPSASVTISSRLVPEYREYPRVSTTLVNACLQPIMSHYLNNLEDQVAVMGLTVPPRILMSHGGIASPRTAGDEPVRTLASGPSAGVMGAIASCKLLGAVDLVTFDVGGTSTDVTLVVGGIPAMTREKEVSGYPIKTDMIDVHSVGAGGGSIAWVDNGGFLQVGPQSAGAEPGPACYGRGGTLPTVTDANLLLHRLNARGLLDGRMPLYVDGAQQSIKTHIAQPLGMSPVEAAHSIIRVVNANIVKAIRLISVEKGYDPRDFQLVAYGGAGPAHAVALADDLGFPGVLVPPSPGTLCALGLLVAETQRGFSRTRILPATSASQTAMDGVFFELEQQAQDWLREEAPNATPRLERLVDVRYVGQSFELTVPLTDHDVTVAQIADRFYAMHHQSYGYSSMAACEFITFRVRGRASMSRPSVGLHSETLPKRASATETRLVYFDDLSVPVKCSIYNRLSLRIGHELEGPAIVEEMDSTVVVPDRWKLSVVEHGFLSLTPIV